MSTTTIQTAPPAEDAVSNVLKWVLLLVAIATFAGLGWATWETYRAAPPQPDSFVTADGTVVMTGADIIAGKGGFQRADLMDYGSLYGMGSYFGEDYTASNLVALANLTDTNIATTQFGRPYAALRPEQQWLVRNTMQLQLHGLDLTARQVVVPPALAAAIVTLRGQISSQLLHDDFAKGWTHAASLDATSAPQTADFLIFSS
jgi:nitric oxide reductase subunit B